MTVSLRADAALDAYVEYGPASGGFTGQTPPVVVPAAGTALVALPGLQPATAYRYRVRYRAPGQAAFATDTTHGFQTRRGVSDTFTFVVQADPHLDDNSSTAVYQQALLNELADQPDFLVDLGDTSMAEKCVIGTSSLCAPPSPPSESAVRARTELARRWFETVGHSLPLFLVLGNHDGESGWVANPSSASLDAWSLAARKSLFPNPEPDGFYSGSSEPAAGGGLRQNYYAFEWGGAAFFMLDPYAYTMKKPGSDGWGWTLGATQYQWFARALAASRARYKFVFIHHLLGGNGSETRGGAAFAGLYEWGGRNLDGSWGFTTQRPGWSAPLESLMRDANVTAIFHGHDHLYAREVSGALVYQEVPQPSLARYDTPDPAAGYGYVGTVGTNIFPSSGHLRVTVSSSEVRVEYVRAVAPADETATRRNRAIIDTYTVR